MSVLFRCDKLIPSSWDSARLLAVGHTPWTGHLFWAPATWHSLFEVWVSLTFYPLCFQYCKIPPRVTSMWGFFSPVSLPLELLHPFVTITHVTEFAFQSSSGSIGRVLNGGNVDVHHQRATPSLHLHAAAISLPASPLFNSLWKFHLCWSIPSFDHPCS